MTIPERSYDTNSIARVTRERWMRVHAARLHSVRLRRRATARAFVRKGKLSGQYFQSLS